ncbi:gp143 [Bacillus phage G]|uniref:Gp143 n=1 Tax=Bacillus phage G TaxID=2884420 RepID=G3MBK9_9CAUD|nr:gp143 [Bacillus phage G]AEO93405.1 gp143 [Bacillus phage G]
MDNEMFKLFVEKVVNNEYLTDTEKLNAIKGYLNDPENLIYNMVLDKKE